MGLTPLGPGLDSLGCTSLLSYNVVMISRLCSWAVDDASRIIRFSDNVAWLKKYVPEKTEGLKIWGNRGRFVGGIICSLVGIGLTDLTKFGGANATLPSGSAGPVYLLLRYRVQPYILTWTPVGGFYPLASISQCAILLQFVSQPKASII